MTEQELMERKAESSGLSWTPVTVALGFAGPLVLLGLAQWLVALALFPGGAVTATGNGPLAPTASDYVNGTMTHVGAFLIGFALVVFTWIASRRGRTSAAWVLAFASVGAGLLVWI